MITFRHLRKFLQFPVYFSLLTSRRPLTSLSKRCPIFSLETSDGNEFIPSGNLRTFCPSHSSFRILHWFFFRKYLVWGGFCFIWFSYTSSEFLMRSLLISLPLKETCEAQRISFFLKHHVSWNQSRCNKEREVEQDNSIESRSHWDFYSSSNQIFQQIRIERRIIHVSHDI